MMSKISKFLWSFLGVALFGFLIFVIVMFSTNRTGILHEDVIPGIRNDISEIVYQEIYKGGKHATNIILTSSPVNLVKNADCTYL